MSNRGINTVELSKMTGVSRSYISQLCSGTNDNPSIYVIVQISKALNVTPNDLINYIGE